MVGQGSYRDISLLLRRVELVIRGCTTIIIQSRAYSRTVPLSLHKVELILGLYHYYIEQSQLQECTTIITQSRAYSRTVPLLHRVELVIGMYHYYYIEQSQLQGCTTIIIQSKAYSRTVPLLLHRVELILDCTTNITQSRASYKDVPLLLHRVETSYRDVPLLLNRVELVVGQQYLHLNLTIIRFLERTSLDHTTCGRSLVEKSGCVTGGAKFKVHLAGEEDGVSEERVKLTT